MKNTEISERFLKDVLIAVVAVVVLVRINCVSSGFAPEINAICLALQLYTPFWLFL